MELILTNHIEVSATPAITKKLAHYFTFNNQKYLDALEWGRATDCIDKFIYLAQRVDERTIILPIGLKGYLEKYSPTISDQRQTIPADIQFNGVLRPYQHDLIQKALIAKGGVLEAPTGSGKTVCALALAAQLQQRTLILVKSKALAEQWKSVIKTFCGVEAGLIGAGKDTQGEQFTIALTQTLHKRDLAAFNYGLVICDEAHAIAAQQAYKIINGLSGRYKYGLTATPHRKDKLEFLIFAALGTISAKVEADHLTNEVMPVKIRTIHHAFNADYVGSWAEFCDVLVDDPERNELIANLATYTSEKKAVIILCSQVRHCDILAECCKAYGAEPLVIHGKLSATERRERMQQASAAPLIIGTVQLLGEGINWPHLSALVMACPISASIDREPPTATRLIQAIGRCRRPFKGKSHASVLDIIDEHPLGLSAWRKRHVVYKSLGFSIEPI